MFRTAEDVLPYMLLGWIVLPIVAGLWARAWNRGSPVKWAVITFFLTPFGFWVVALTLLLGGRRRPQAGP